jgi:heparanase 1
MRAPLAARSSGSAWQRLCVAATFATLVCVAAPAEAQTVVTVSDATPLQTLDALYQGYNIDSGSLYNGIALDTDVLVQLTRNLAPAQLRIGGSASDSVWYCPDAPDGATQGPTPDPLAPNYAALAAPGYAGYVPEATIMNDNLWRAVTGFAEASGTSLLWNLNAVDFRTPAGAWDPTLNASALFAFTAAQGLKVASWELGNEPDIWPKHFGMNVTGTQLAADLRTLQASLVAAGLSTALAGPSLATYNAPIVQSFLQGWQSSGGGALSFTTHAYPLGPPTYAPNSTRPSCSSSNYLNLTRVNNIATYLGEFTAAVQQFGDPAATRMVLEETASNSLGGCVGYSDRFISGFYWLNILGLVAESSFQQINRQDLAGMSFTASGSQYTLFGPPGWVNGSGLVDGTSPHPDYFTSLLFRRLMGSQVLASTVTPSAAGSFAAHVWCAAPTAPGAGPGAVTVAFINAATTPASFQVVGADGAAYAKSPRSEFVLTGDKLTDSVMYLNAPAGALSKLERAATRLRVNKDGSLPDSLVMPTGRLVSDAATQLLVPPLSYGFMVLPAANAPACSGVVAAPAPALPAAGSVKASPQPAAQKHDLVHVALGVILAAMVSGAVLAWARMQNVYARPYDDRRKLLPESSDSPRYGGV